jgi:cytoskeletal protein CcmA (bactofilin family)
MHWVSALRFKLLGRKRFMGGRSLRLADPRHDQIGALLGHNFVLHGDIYFSAGLRIDGTVHGDVLVSGITAGTLTIGDSGRVEGSIRASHIIVYGQVLGHIYATGMVDVRPAAQIQGDVHYGSIEISPGAKITGRLFCNSAST